MKTFLFLVCLLLSINSFATICEEEMLVSQSRKTFDILKDELEEVIRFYHNEIVPVCGDIRSDNITKLKEIATKLEANISEQEKVRGDRKPKTRNRLHQLQLKMTPLAKDFKSELNKIRLSNVE